MHRFGAERSRIPGQLQVRINSIIAGMIGFGKFATLDRRFEGAPIGRYRVLPCADPREDMRRHVQRVRRVGRDAGIKPRGGEAASGERGRVV